MSNVIYEASVYTRTVSYRNFNGGENTVTLSFALDPISLMELIADRRPDTIKSGNPAINGKPADISNADQLRFVKDLAIQAAGAPSDDGESWIRNYDFEESLAGKAFLTKLASSDTDRREFSEKVIMEPFRAFVNYAKSDPENTKSEVQQFEVLLKQMENVFKTPDKKQETVEEKRARLAQEMAALNAVPGEVVE